MGDFLESLKDENGKPVPVIFRPWHENNGSWFWWGQKLCSDEEFKSLWNLLQDYLVGRGLDNLLWSYSPNLDGNWTTERFMARYPGNDRVTLIGEDAYQWGTEADFVKQLNADLTFLTKFAKDNGKLLAMTECGMQNTNILSVTSCCGVTMTRSGSVQCPIRLVAKTIRSSKRQKTSCS